MPAKVAGDRATIGVVSVAGWKSNEQLDRVLAVELRHVLRLRGQGGGDTGRGEPGGHQAGQSVDAGPVHGAILSQIGFSPMTLRR
jgi:hypothetical protein